MNEHCSVTNLVNIGYDSVCMVGVQRILTNDKCFEAVLCKHRIAHSQPVSAARNIDTDKLAPATDESAYLSIHVQ